VISRKKREAIPLDIQTAAKGISEILQALPVVGTIDVDNNTFTPTGDQMLAEAIQEPTMDRYLDRSPKVGQPIDYPAMVALLHKKREMFITAEAKRKSGVKDEEPTE
jgi:hypothetical protein